MLDANERLKYLSTALGQGSLSRDGVNASFRCPKCAHKDKFKLVVKLDNEKWHCWVCGIKGGSVASLLSKHAKEYRSGWIQRFGTVEQKKFIDDIPEKEVLSLPDGFLPLLGTRLDPDFTAVLKYLDSRGIGEKEIWRYRLGTTLRGKCRRRAIITSYDFEGKLNYWTARSIDESSTVKYTNPRVERKDVIFNELDIDWTKELTIVEGPFDLISIGGNSTCLLGSSLSSSHALFERIVGNQTPVILALDNDMKKKSHDIARLLFRHNISVKILDTREYKDVGEMPQDILKDELKNALPWNPNDRLFHLIRNISSGSML